MRRVLITTAIEETWPAADVPVLFLGEWCKLHSRKAAWEKRDAITLDYHWEDRDKLYKDYVYLQNLYEDLLEETANNLNKLHGTCHSKKYWRILVGPWLNYFIHILYDRWSCIGRALQSNGELVAKTIEYRVDDLVPNDMEHFTKLMVSDDWNEKIYADLIMWTDIRRNFISIDSNLLVLDPSPQKRSIKNIKKLDFSSLGAWKKLLPKNKAYFLKSTGLGIEKNLLLQLMLGQLPFTWRANKLPVEDVNLAMRKWDVPTVDSYENFSAIIRSMVPKQIPVVYIEGYAKLNSMIEVANWPKNPKSIYTTMGHVADDFFKAWAAKMVDSGTPLIIGQHGGTYGIAKWFINEDHEKMISDAYLTWGWEKLSSSKVYPIGVSWRANKIAKTTHDNSQLLLIQQSLPRYSYKLCAEPVGPIFRRYLDDQFLFARCLSSDLINALTVRVWDDTHGWSLKERWKEKFPNVEIDLGEGSLFGRMESAKINVVSYNGTTFLESLAHNFPTIIFWNLRHYELSVDAAPHFERLKSVGIFYDTPEGAAQQVIKVWGDVGAWWKSEEVQSVRREFCEKYAHIPDRPLVKISKIIRKVAVSPKVMS